MISIIRRSQLTGKLHTMTLDVTEEQIEKYKNGEGLIQHIFPNLTADEREFIKNGITPEEWTNEFGNES